MLEAGQAQTALLSSMPMGWIGRGIVACGSAQSILEQGIAVYLLHSQRPKKNKLRRCLLDATDAIVADNFQNCDSLKYWSEINNSKDRWTSHTREKWKGLKQMVINSQTQDSKARQEQAVAVCHCSRTRPWLQQPTGFVLLGKSRWPDQCWSSTQFAN